MSMIRAIIIIAASGLLSFLLFGGWRAFDPNAAPPQARVPTHSEARSTCRRHVRDRLHDPSRADWMDWRNWPVTRAQGGVTVHMTFRAPNAMGAVIMVSRNCHVVLSGEYWRVTGIEDR